MKEKKTAAGLLRSIRESQGRSLRAVASDLGVAPSQLSRLERGERNYTPSITSRLAEYYGLSKETLELLEGRVPTDIIEILQLHPEEIVALRAKYGASDEGVGVADESVRHMD